MRLNTKEPNIVRAGQSAEEDQLYQYLMKLMLRNNNPKQLELKMQDRKWSVEHEHGSSFKLICLESAPGLFMRLIEATPQRWRYWLGNVNDDLEVTAVCRDLRGNFQHEKEGMRGPYKFRFIEDDMNFYWWDEEQVPQQVKEAAVEFMRRKVGNISPDHHDARLNWTYAHTGEEPEYD